MRAIVAVLAALLFPALCLGQAKPHENSLGMVFRPVPAGTYRVGPRGLAPRAAVNETGNPTAGAEVTIAAPFLMCVHEVRIRDYMAFCKATNHPQPSGEGYDASALRWKSDFKPLAQQPMTETTSALPVTCVTYDDAIAFCKWLSGKEGRSYRLPTEIEWEYAARAGSDKPYINSDRFDMHKINGNLAEGRLLPANPEEGLLDTDAAAKPDAADGSALMTARDKALLAKNPPNAWGLYHMIGNVQEFVVMTRGPLDDELPLPGYTLLPGKVNRMLRGGSWLHDERDCTVFRALYTCPPYTNVTIGFRVVLDDGKTGPK